MNARESQRQRRLQESSFMKAGGAPEASIAHHLKLTDSQASTEITFTLENAAQNITVEARIRAQEILEEFRRIYPL